MTIEIKHFVQGFLDNNTYIISDEKGCCVLIDAPPQCTDVINYIGGKKLTLDSIILTHAHFDHIMGLPLLLQNFPQTPVYVHPDDRPYLTNPQLNASTLMGEGFIYEGPTRELAEGLQTIGPFTFTISHIPGHTPGGCALILDGNCFSGDTLFAGSVGRSDFDGGDGEKLLAGIREKLLPLPEDTIVCPGHGGRTTISREKRLNPFFFQRS